jgi:GntR family transcriptional regulator
VVKGTAELQRPVPLYMQVVRQLRAQIASGDLAEGERIPSQREMMQHWHISMQTASKVIGSLKTEGLAIPSVGRDTVVAAGAAARIASASACTAAADVEPAASASLETRASAAMTAAPPDVAEILGISAGRRALRRVETHIDDGEPVDVTITWFAPAVTTAAPRLADSKPLPAGALAYVSEATDFRVTRVLEEHAAMAAGKDTAKTLGVPAGSPVLATKTRHLGASGQLIAYSETTAGAGNWRGRAYTVTGSR